MTIRYAIRETETHPGKFPNGLDTSVEDIYAAQGEDFHSPPQAWALTVLSPYSGELPKVTVYRTREGAKAAMEADIKETLDADDPTFDAEDLTREGDDHASLGDEIHWRIERLDIKD